MLLVENNMRVIKEVLDTYLAYRDSEAYAYEGDRSCFLDGLISNLQGECDYQWFVEGLTSNYRLYQTCVWFVTCLDHMINKWIDLSQETKDRYYNQYGIIDFCEENLPAGLMDLLDYDHILFDKISK